jgi:glutamate-1-semialdehyde 2,1-aminomutase
MTDVARHEALIPMGTQVSSKGRFRNCRGFGPEWIIGGDGAYVEDPRGRKYLDWSCGLGALTIGHNGIAIAPACLPLPHPVELTLAEKLHAWIPCAEMVRFMKTGSDATSAAIRLARVFTGRDRIVDAGNYHGIGDWTIAAEHEGVPKCVRDLTIRVPFNNLAALEDQLNFNDVATVIMEPVSLIAPEPGYLETVKEICQRHGTLLIFDEVITGIRMAKGGAQEVYGVTPDLCCIGKGMANGYPISAVCGRRGVMEFWSRTHLSGTHFADPACMEAALMIMNAMDVRDFWKHQEHIGGRLLALVSDLIATWKLSDVMTARGHAHWWVLQIPDPLHQTLVQQEMIRRGVLGSNGSHFVSLAHTHGDVIKTADAYGEAFRVLRGALDADNLKDCLECEVNRTVFRRA